MNGNRRVGVWFVAALWIASCASALLGARVAAADEPDAGPEAVVHQLYDLVTFGAGEQPDWEQVRSLFLPEAVIVLRTSRDRTSVFTREGFVQDFVRFIEETNVREVGFEEKIVRTHATVCGDMATIHVLYEAHIPGSARPPQPGVDSFLLSRRDAGWKIVAITNEIPTAQRPLPAVLQE